MNPSPALDVIGLIGLTALFILFYLLVAAI